MDPRWFPYNNMSKDELLAAAERDGNHLALALHHLMSEEIANGAGDSCNGDCEACNELRNILADVENDDNFDQLDDYVQRQVRNNS